MNKLLFFFLFGRRADIIRDFKTGDSLCYAFIGELFALFIVYLLSLLLILNNTIYLFTRMLM